MDITIPRRLVPLKDLKRHPRNPRTISDNQMSKLRESFADKEVGYIENLVWNEVTGYVLSGNQRVRLFRHNGATDEDRVEVGVLHIEDPAKEYALLLWFNRGGGEFLDEEVKKLLLEIDAANPGLLDLTGFEEKELDDFLKATAPVFNGDEEDPLADKKTYVVCPDCGTEFEPPR